MMRIISKFHDYYDCIQKQAMDRSVLFLRDQKKFHVESKEDKEIVKCVPRDLIGECASWQDARNGYSCTLFLLGFCGDLFPGVKFSISPKRFYEPHSNVFLWTAYRPEEYMTAFESYGEKSCIWNYHRFYSHSEGLRKEIDEWLTTCTLSTHFWWKKKFERTNLPEIQGWFQKYKIPMFMVNIPDYYVVFNPCLKDVRFFSVMSPEQAFQKIQQFLTNDLADQRDGIVKPVPEKDRLIGHGFDPKWSFRKEPEEK